MLQIDHSKISMTNIKINTMEQKYPLPPFTMETALQKVQLAEDMWNSKDPERVCLAYTIDTEW